MFCGFISSTVKALANLEAVKALAGLLRSLSLGGSSWVRCAVGRVARPVAQPPFRSLLPPTLDLHPIVRAVRIWHRDHTAGPNTLSGAAAPPSVPAPPFHHRTQRRESDSCCSAPSPHPVHASPLLPLTALGRRVAVQLQKVAGPRVPFVLLTAWSSSIRGRSAVQACPSRWAATSARGRPRSDQGRRCHSTTSRMQARPGASTVVPMNVCPASRDVRD